MNKKSKVLIFDIETSANLGYVWGKWETNVIEFKEEWHMLCYSYKWLDEKTTHVVALPDFPGYKKDKKNDMQLVKSLWELFDQADVIVAHNGNSFDIKMSNVRFAKHKLGVPSPYKQQDTKLIAKKYFRFLGNSLNDLAKFFGFGEKVKHEGFEMWLSCDNGDMKTWAKMKKYNKQDVVLLDKIYNELRAWTKSPCKSNTNGFCPDIACGSDKLQKRGTEVRKGGVRYQRLVCLSCGQWCYGEKICPTV